MRKTFQGLEISTTLKIHALIEHLEHCLYFLDNDGLGLWSEQCGEAIHREFLKQWKKYAVNSIDHEFYGERLKRAVVEFSSAHL